MNISIIHPSYGRPELAEQTRELWLQRSTQPVHEYIMCCSESDPLLPRYKEPYITHVAANMVVQMNYAASKTTGDLVVAVSDDFECPEGWDDLLRGVATPDCCIKTHDGVHGDGIDTKKIVSLPIMSRAYYERYGYIYHPKYNHFYGDEELFFVATREASLITADITFEHIHHAVGKAVKDDTNKKNSTHFKRDKLTFISRKSLGFP